MASNSPVTKMTQEINPFVGAHICILTRGSTLSPGARIEKDRGSLLALFITQVSANYSNEDRASTAKKFFRHDCIISISSLLRTPVRHNKILEYLIRICYQYGCKTSIISSFHELLPTYYFIHF